VAERTGERKDDRPCKVCNSSEREGDFLLCDQCDQPFHLDCLDPPLDMVPMSDWFCDECTQRAKVEDAKADDVQLGAPVPPPGFNFAAACPSSLAKGLRVMKKFQHPPEGWKRSWISCWALGKITSKVNASKRPDLATFTHNVHYQKVATKNQFTGSVYSNLSEEGFGTEWVALVKI
jgi:hypothetical protein